MEDQAHVPSSLWYKWHLCRQLNCWSLRCSWSIACRHCSNYIIILYLTPGFNRLGKDKCKTRRESFTFWDLVCLILVIKIYWCLIFRWVAETWHGSRTVYSATALSWHAPLYHEKQIITRYDIEKGTIVSLLEVPYLLIITAPANRCQFFSYFPQ